MRRSAAILACVSSATLQPSAEPNRTTCLAAFPFERSQASAAITSSGPRWTSSPSFSFGSSWAFKVSVPCFVDPPCPRRSSASVVKPAVSSAGRSGLQELLSLPCWWRQIATGAFGAFEAVYVASSSNLSAPGKRTTSCAEAVAARRSTNEGARIIMGVLPSAACEPHAPCRGPEPARPA